MIKICDSIRLPVDVVTQTMAIIAKRRAGKSYLSRRLVEQLHVAHQQVVIVDPKGDHWGLRSSADGKAPGLPIVILGGERGDVPLEAGAGEIVAKLVVEERVSALLDLSFLRKHEVATFMTAFLESLYRQKAREQFRTPLMLVIDEADAVAPQSPMKGEERMLGAAEDIVRRGGQRGIGCTMITQRSAVLNKNVLTQAQVLVALRTIAPQDLKAVNAWIDVHGTDAERKTLMASLPSLPVGDAWFWSPGWPTTEGIFARGHVLPIETYDSGATPKPGEKRREPRSVADVDLDALRRQMAATIEKAKADDPRELKKKLADAQKEIARLTTSRPVLVASGPKLKMVEFPVIREAQVNKLLAMGTAINKVVDGFAARMQKIVEPLKDVASEIDAALARLHRAANAETYQPKGKPDVVPMRQPKQPLMTSTTNYVSNGHTRRGGKRSAEERILDALRWWEYLGVEWPSRNQVGLVARINPSGGYFDNVVRPLVAAGHVERTDGAVRLLASGRALAEPPAETTTLDEYHASIRQQIRDGATRRMLDAIIANGRDAIDRAALGAAAAVNPTGGYFDNVLRPLATLGVVARAGGRVTPTPLLFPPELA